MLLPGVPGQGGEPLPGVEVVSVDQVRSDEIAHEMDRIKKLLYSLPDDETRLQAIGCMCKYCGQPLEPGQRCYCYADD